MGKDDKNEIHTILCSMLSPGILGLCSRTALRMMRSPYFSRKASTVESSRSRRAIRVVSVNIQLVTASGYQFGITVAVKIHQIAVAGGPLPAIFRLRDPVQIGPLIAENTGIFLQKSLPVLIHQRLRVLQQGGVFLIHRLQLAVGI